MGLSDPLNQYIRDNYSTSEHEKYLLWQIISDIIEVKLINNKWRKVNDMLMELNRNDDTNTVYSSSALNEIIEDETASVQSDNVAEQKSVTENKLTHQQYYQRLEAQFRNYETAYTEKFYEYRACVIKKKHMYNNMKKSLKLTKEAKSIIVLKYQNITLKINIIQLSIIFISTLITFFETIKTSYEMPPMATTIMTSYIALILSVMRFLKMDIIKEQLNNVIEKYTTIVNKLRYNRNIINKYNFHGKNDTADNWHNLVSSVEKDSIDTLVTEASHDYDILMTLNEKATYYNIYVRQLFLWSKEIKNKEMVANNLSNNDFNLNQYSTKNPKWYHKCAYFFCGTLSCRKDKFCCCNPRELENGNAQNDQMTLLTKPTGNNFTSFYNHITGQNTFLELFNDIRNKNNESSQDIRRDQKNYFEYVWEHGEETTNGDWKTIRSLIIKKHRNWMAYNEKENFCYLTKVTEVEKPIQLTLIDDCNTNCNNDNNETTPNILMTTLEETNNRESSES